MKKSNILFMVLFGLASLTIDSCVSSNLSNSQSSTAELKARDLTEKMASELGLSTTQTEKILLLNLVNYRIVSKLIETNDTKKISSAQETYKSEIRQVLTVSQYEKFLSSFKGL